MSNRKIISIQSAKSKKIVLAKLNELNNYPKDTTIQKYKRDFKLNNAEKTYKVLQEMYNMEVDIVRQKKALEIKKTKLNNLLSVIHYEPSLSISKMSRDERIKRNSKILERQNQIRTSKELKASQFTNMYCKK